MKPALALAVACAVGFGHGCGRAPLGGACERDRECAGDGQCKDGRCVMPAARDRALVEQSGIGAAPPELPAIEGRPVRVRSTEGNGTIFAACAVSERLLGGGCRGGEDGENSAHIRSWPGEYSATDTIGARWYCSGKGRLVAFALCQHAQTEPNTPPPAPSEPVSEGDAAGHSRAPPDL